MVRWAPSWVSLSDVAPGANVVLCELEPGAREAAAEKLLKETGGVMIPPYDHVDVIAGQGTVALEFLQQVRCALVLHTLISC